MNKLLEMSRQFPQTRVWNDSCSIRELTYCMENGGVGATTNPVIVKEVLGREFSNYEDWIKGLISENPSASEDELAWMVIEKLAPNMQVKMPANSVGIKAFEEATYRGVSINARC